MHCHEASNLRFKNSSNLKPAVASRNLEQSFMTLNISSSVQFAAAASRSLENWVTTCGDLVKRTEEDAETESGMSNLLAGLVSPQTLSDIRLQRGPSDFTAFSTYRMQDNECRILGTAPRRCDLKDDCTGSREFWVEKRGIDPSRKKGKFPYSCSSRPKSGIR